MQFKWQNTTYAIKPFDKLNIIVERVIDGPGTDKTANQSEHRGRSTYHGTWESALLEIAKDGCRDVNGQSIGEVIHNLSCIRKEIDRSIQQALHPQEPEQE